MTRTRVRVDGQDYVVETGGPSGPVVRYQLDGCSASMRGELALQWLRKHGFVAELRRVA